MISKGSLQEIKCKHLFDRITIALYAYVVNWTVLPKVKNGFWKVKRVGGGVDVDAEMVLGKFN